MRLVCVIRQLTRKINGKMTMLFFKGSAGVQTSDLISYNKFKSAEYLMRAL